MGALSCNFVPAKSKNMAKKIIITSIVLLALVGGIVAKLISNKTQAEKGLQKNASIPVQVMTDTTDVKTAIYPNEFSYVGKTEANREIQVNSTAQGIVKTINMSLNAHVSAGQVLVELDTDLLKNQVELSEHTLEKYRRDLSRLEALKAENNISVLEVENARLQVKNAESQLFSLKKQIQDATIKAPIDGQIVEKNVEKGIYLNPSSAVATLTDVSVVKLVVQVPENELTKFKNGRSIAVSFDAYPSQKFMGRVNLIRLKGGEAGRFPVEIIVQNSSASPLRVGMVGVVNL
jgi:RND family efflux transporter MFP subunit